MINDIFYFINRSERKALRKLINKDSKDCKITKRLCILEYSFYEVLHIESDDNTFDTIIKEDMFNNLVLDRIYNFEPCKL